MKLINIFTVAFAAPVVYAGNLRLGALTRGLEAEEQAFNACIDVPTVPDTCSSVPYGKCTPFRSPDSCPLWKSFQLLVHRRALTYKNYPDQVEEEMYWFHHLEDKTAQYMFSASEGFRAPKIYFCTSDGNTGLDDFEPTMNAFVIRATTLHSGMGIYVLPNGYNNIELLRDSPMSFADIKADLQKLNATDVLVEEYIPGYGTNPLPTEYKFHVFNGEIGAINVVLNRGTACQCWAEVDTEWNRLDRNGCFTPSDSTDSAGTCDFAIDFAKGSENAYPMKGFDLCSDIPKPEDCVLSDMIDVAKEASKKIGVYARIDMFVSATKEIVIQEYTINHNNGLRHCSSKTDMNGCIDPCFLGAMWDDASSTGNTLFGGPLTNLPVSITEWKDASNKCQVAMAIDVSPVKETSCVNIQQAPDPPLPAPLPPPKRPSLLPTVIASMWPSRWPSNIPSFNPSDLPSPESNTPTIYQSGRPTNVPSSPPSTESPTGTPSTSPSKNPSEPPSSSPSKVPSIQTTKFPTSNPSQEPSSSPSLFPTHVPSTTPSNSPSVVRSEIPSSPPSARPTALVSDVPSQQPSSMPSSKPSEDPTDSPSPAPSQIPSSSPTLDPTKSPSTSPSATPSDMPSPSPSRSPSMAPTSLPSLFPTHVPSTTPSTSPSVVRSEIPSPSPSARPTALVSDVPSQQPSSMPSSKPSEDPTDSPSPAPSQIPSSSPTLDPTKSPSTSPSATPSDMPSPSPSRSPSMAPTSLPSLFPTHVPSTTPSTSPSVVRSEIPSSPPSARPTALVSDVPSQQPSSMPSSKPSEDPTDSPSPAPSQIPSSSPTLDPTKSPSTSPSATPSDMPSPSPSRSPSMAPTSLPSLFPTHVPSTTPSTSPSVVRSEIPSPSPSARPTALVSDVPSQQPSSMPSSKPSEDPTDSPSPAPSQIPSSSPTLDPTKSPSTSPSATPSDMPSPSPSRSPSMAPTSLPSLFPTHVPSTTPSTSPSVVRSEIPSSPPSARPTALVSDVPSQQPSSMPSSKPSEDPTDSPSPAPSQIPPSSPTLDPTKSPSTSPSATPSDMPSPSPSRSPSMAPTSLPSLFPTHVPSTTPSNSPSVVRSEIPSSPPSARPTALVSDVPSQQPSSMPSSKPSEDPTDSPSPAPSRIPSSSPTLDPTKSPSTSPSATPSDMPSPSPSRSPSMAPTSLPSLFPTHVPSTTPSTSPSVVRSEIPSSPPSARPTALVSDVPSQQPSSMPSSKPSEDPTDSPSPAPSQIPSSSPTLDPTKSPSTSPSATPSGMPSPSPSQTPSSVPSTMPSTKPSVSPTLVPSSAPSVTVSASPSILPSTVPSGNPTLKPTMDPTPMPSPSPTTTKPSPSPTTTKPSPSPTTTKPSPSPTTTKPSPSPSTTIPSLSPTTTKPSASPVFPIVNAPCIDKCNVVDFDYMPDGTTRIARGQYISDQWKEVHGLLISVSGNGNEAYTPIKNGIHQARIFDTANPGTNNDNGDPDLGSPNKKCADNPGPGVGVGGEPGKPGENCQSMGNVLIIQENNKTAPDDNAGGGNFTFTFDNPVRFNRIGLMDIDDPTHELKVYLKNGTVIRISYPALGNNAVQTVDVLYDNVVKVVVQLCGSGAVTFLDFCPTTCAPLVIPRVNQTPPPSPSPTTTKPSPSPTMTKPSPSPTTTKPSPSPTTTKPSPSPTTAKPSPSPTTTKPSPSPTTTKPSPSPTTTKPSPSPSTTIPSLSPTTTKPSASPVFPIVNAPCIDKCNVVDFDYMPDGTTRIARGQYISDQWKEVHGLLISVSGNGNEAYTPIKNGIHQARIFDTANPGTNNDNGDPDLGSPNKKCADNPGPGVGVGGEPGKPGENCQSMGNVLIIQENNKTAPDDNAGGGNFTFTFDNPVRFNRIGLMDIDDPTHELKVYLKNGTVIRISYPALGNNAVQTVDVLYDNVVKVVVQLCGSGAVTFLDFCPTTCAPLVIPRVNQTPPPSPSPTTTKPSPSPTMTKPSPSPTTTKPSPSPTTTKPSPSPTTAKPSPSPTTTKPSPSPTTTKPSPSPTTTKPSPSPSTTIPSLSPTTTKPSASPVFPIVNAPCIDKCNVVDFDYMPDGTTRIARGQYISDQWKEVHGLLISVSGNGNEAYTPIKNGIHQARIFDTANPGTNNDNGDPDLGSPNKKCADNPGPGVGVGGEPGKPGENCQSMGNVLIIQENNKTAPDDNAGGGNFTFTFDNPVRFNRIGLMDIDDPTHELKVYLKNGTVIRISYPALGNNAVQTVDVLYDNVVKVVVQLCGSGAVTFLDFCPTTCAPLVIPPVNKAPLPFDCSYKNDNKQCLYNSSTFGLPSSSDPFNNFVPTSGQYDPNGVMCNPGNWNIWFTERIYDPFQDTTTFVYTINNLKLNKGDKDISHSVIGWTGTCCVVGASYFGGSGTIVAAGPENVDPTTGVVGIKFDQGWSGCPKNDQGHKVSEHIIVMSGDVPLAKQATIASIKGGNGFCLYLLDGPSCPCV